MRAGFLQGRLDREQASLLALRRSRFLSSVRLLQAAPRRCVNLLWGGGKKKQLNKFTKY